MNNYKKPFFSVIIPTYNRKPYIQCAIKSVLKQTFHNYEIIVVDDGSVDNTGVIIAPYVEAGKIKYIYQNNSGVSVARNTGILNSIGEWVAYLDSDDEWDPHYLEYQYNRVQEHKGVVTHMCNSEAVDINGNRINTFDENTVSSLLKIEDKLVFERPLYYIIKYRLTTLQSTIMRRKELLQTSLFDNSLSIAEDHDIIIKMAEFGPLAIYKAVLAFVIRREENFDNLSKQIFVKGVYSCNAFESIYKRALHTFDCNKKESNIIMKRLSSNRRALGNIYILVGDKINARLYFKESLELHLSINSLIKYILSLFPTNMSKYFIVKGKHIHAGE